MPNYTVGLILKNKIGATTPEEFKDKEAPLLAARAIELVALKATANFDANHLRRIRRYLFQDVFEWAGRTRDESLRCQTVQSQRNLS